MKKRYIVLLIIGILWNIFIFTQSLLPSNNSSELSGFLSQNIYKILTYLNINVNPDNLHFILRKLAHFTEFFILGILWSAIYHKLHNKMWIYMTLLYGFVVAFIDESIQTFIPGRDGNFIDVIIDFSGILISVFIYIFISYLTKKIKE